MEDANNWKAQICLYLLWLSLLPVNWIALSIKSLPGMLVFVKLCVYTVEWEYVCIYGHRCFYSVWITWKRKGHFCCVTWFVFYSFYFLLNKLFSLYAIAPLPTNTYITQKLWLFLVIYIRIILDRTPRLVHIMLLLMGIVSCPLELCLGSCNWILKPYCLRNSIL